MPIVLATEIKNCANSPLWVLSPIMKSVMGTSMEIHFCTSFPPMARVNSNALVSPAPPA